MPVETPDNLESEGRALGTRSPLEARYAAAVESEVETFLGEVRRYADDSASGAGPMFLATVLLMWTASISRLERTIPADSSLLAAMRESELPNRAFEAASSQVAESATLGIRGAELRARIETSLGLARTPVEGLKGQYGRMLVAPDGSSVRSWSSESESLARTAATADLGASMLEQLRAQGYTHKRWATRYDSRVRETHANVDRNTILLDESFIVGGSALRFPADPMATDLSQVINCRCVLVGVRYGRHELAQPYGETPWNNPRPS